MSSNTVQDMIETAVLMLVSSKDGRLQITHQDDLPEPARRRFKDKMREIAERLAVDPAKVHVMDAPEVADWAGLLREPLRTGLDEAFDDDFFGLFNDLVLMPIEQIWRERVFDLLVFVGRESPSERAQSVLYEAVESFLVGHDRAAAAMARSVADTILDDLVESESPPKTRWPSSPWAISRGRKVGKGTSPFVRIEQLHSCNRISDEEAESFHEIREIGNRSIHEGAVAKGETLSALLHLQRVIRFLGQ